MPRDPRVEKLQRLRSERSTRAPGGYYGTRATVNGNVQGAPRRRDAGRTLLSLVIFVAFVVGGLYAVSQYALHGIRTAAPAAQNDRTVTVVVAPGESVTHLADRLQADGLIVNATIFHWYLRLSGIGGTIQAGPHTLHTGMSMDEVVHALSTRPPAAPTAVVRILPGWRAEQVAEALARAGVASYDDAMREITRGKFNYPFLADRPMGAGVEGYLLPDDYVFLLHRGAHYAIARMLRNFGQKVSPATVAQGKKVYGSFYKAVIMASIVERESGTPQDDALIAGVYLNRLHDASGTFQKLNADATVQYAMGRPGDWWPANIDTGLPSKYNTYQQVGLPPGPIAEPSAATIVATVNPKRSTYFYYWHRNGSHGKSIFCTAQQGAQCEGTPQ